MRGTGLRAEGGSGTLPRFRRPFIVKGGELTTYIYVVETTNGNSHPPQVAVFRLLGKRSSPISV
jgi:hypothetical protein